MPTIESHSLFNLWRNFTSSSIWLFFSRSMTLNILIAYGIPVLSFSAMLTVLHAPRPIRRPIVRSLYLTSEPSQTLPSTRKFSSSIEIPKLSLSPSVCKRNVWSPISFRESSKFVKLSPMSSVKPPILPPCKRAFMIQALSKVKPKMPALYGSINPNQIKLR